MSIFTNQTEGSPCQFSERQRQTAQAALRAIYDAMEWLWLRCS
jgi:hypothetical protein